MFHKFIYYLKFFIFMFSETFFLVISVAFTFWRGRHGSNGLLGAYCIVQACRLIGIKFQIEGVGYLRSYEPSIFILNHQSVLDLGVSKKLLTIVKHSSAMMKTEVIANIPFGIAAYFCDVIYVSRSSSKGMFSPKNAILRSIKILTVKKRSVLIFPEGTRNGEESLKDFKRGAFEIAIKTGVKVQPIIIQKYNFIDHEKKKFGRGVLKIKILPPLEFLSNESTESYRQRSYQIMSAEYLKLNDQLE